MALEDYSRIATIIFHLLSTIAIGGAAYKYVRSRDERSGETLLQLEARFKELQSRWCAEPGKLLPSITRVVDPEAHEEEASVLQSAIDKGLSGEWLKRDDPENAWMARLDEFLRFLVLVAAMEKNRLLKKKALWDVYHYWFKAVTKNPKLKLYVNLYYPVLFSFLKTNEKEISKTVP